MTDPNFERFRTIFRVEASRIGCPSPICVRALHSSPQAHLFPRYVKLNLLTHEEGRIVVCQGDSALQLVMDDTVASGFDSLSPIVPPTVNVNWVNKVYREHPAIMGNIDLGYTPTHVTSDEIKAAAPSRSRLEPGSGVLPGAAPCDHVSVS